MLSKKEMSELKINIVNQCDDETIKLFADMLKYTQQLEKENETFKDFYINNGKEDTAKDITTTHYEKNKSKGYWQGYIAKQNEAIEICEQCKYRKKARELEADNYEQNDIINDYIDERRELIEKLKDNVEQYRYMTAVVETQGYEEGYYKGHISEAQEILSILKGEKE